MPPAHHRSAKTCRFTPCAAETALHGDSSRALSERASDSLQTADRLSHEPRNHLRDICMHGAVIIVRIQQDFIQTARHRLYLQEVLSLGFDRLRQRRWQRVCMACARSPIAAVSRAHGCAGSRRIVFGSTRGGWGSIALITRSHGDTCHGWVSQVHADAWPRIGTRRNLNVEPAEDAWKPSRRRQSAAVAADEYVSCWGAPPASGYNLV
jgi:hypothetical protein